MQPTITRAQPSPPSPEHPAQGRGVIQIRDALDPAERTALLDELAARGFRATAGRYPAGYRNNDRLVFDDSALAARLFAKLRAHLPAEVSLQDGTRARLVGLNARFRACRYRDGQAFGRHRDGAYAPSSKVRSERTLMLYLSDASQHRGGRTRFYDSSDPAAPPTLCITPEAGLATVFPHDAWHDGEAVTHGTKVVLRSDLLYERLEPASERRSGHRGYVWDLSLWGPGGWVSVGRDGTLRVGRLGSGPRHTLRLRLASPTTVASAPDGVLWVGSRHGEVSSVRPSAASPWRQGLPLRVQRGALLRMLPCAHGVISAGADGVVNVLGPDGVPLARHSLRRAGFLWGLTACGEADSWLVAGEQGRVHRLVFDGSRLHEQARYPLGASVRALSTHPDGGVWAGLVDGRIVELTSGRTLSAHTGPVTALAPLPGARLVSGGEDGQVLLWELHDQPPHRAENPTLLDRRGDFITRLLPTGHGVVLCAGYDGQVAPIRVGRLRRPTRNTPGCARDPLR